MALCPLANFQLVAGVGDQGSAADQAYLDAADAAVKSYIGWNPERVTDTVEYLDGDGTPELKLPGQPVNPSVTEVRLDQIGGFGQAADTFGDDTILTQGDNYFFKAKTHTLWMRRFPSGIWVLGTYGLQVGPSKQWIGLTTGGVRNAYWPLGIGNVKVTYSNGYAAGSIPNDLRQAVIELAVYQRNTTRFGGMVPNSVNYIDTSASLQFAAEAFGALQLPAMGSIRSLLAPYCGERALFPTGNR